VSNNDFWGYSNFSGTFSASAGEVFSITKFLA